MCQSFSPDPHKTRDIAVLTQNKHQIVVSRGSETRNAPKDGELHQVGGVRGEEVAHESTLVGQNHSPHPADLVAQHAERKGAHQGAEEKQRLSDPRLVGILTDPVELWDGIIY